MLSLLVPLWLVASGLSVLSGALGEPEQSGPAAAPAPPAALEKRSPHYDFGLGKRAYSYVSEYKRLPVYNFGLGKRSRPYSFGLGKRSAEEEQPEEVSDGEHVALDDLFKQYDDEAPGYEVKRARPYSFGLGKRFAEDEASEEKRARMYDFGLGKRLPMYNFGLGKRAKSYNFGLGKRLSSKFNFGLGKRLSSKFNFGLGKRLSSKFNFGLGKRSEGEISADPPAGPAAPLTPADTDNYFDI